MNKTALITGASSGFGLLTSITLAQRGWHVLATMRDPNRRENLESAARDAALQDRIEIHQLDVTDADQIAQTTALIASRAQPLHALINNAGFAVPGFAEEVSDAELRDQFNTNFFGATALTRAILPQMRRQRFGHVVMVSSISGRTGFPGVSSYVASKFALEGWTETLRYEMAPLGIKVSIVEPGSFATDIWTRNAKLSAAMSDPDSPNAARLARWQARVQASAKARANPQQVADLIARILETPAPKLRYVIGTDARTALLMRNILPQRLFERLLIKLSGLSD
ncbi:SDR family oxidoreductase [Occallatibacter savannae]|uniref:SDR family oxidoreductase n=1 Tax=Occallatibacter savannae TaxID=1002691 RepID=UPI000D696F79|nr:SDR family oxidoreductase [Occallatibacter savannae]